MPEINSNTPPPKQNVNISAPSTPPPKSHLFLILSVIIIIVIAIGIIYIFSNQNHNSSSTSSPAGTANPIYLTQSQIKILFGSGGNYGEFYYNNSASNFGQILGTNLPLCYDCSSRNYLYYAVGNPAYAGGLANNASDLWTVQYKGKNVNSEASGGPDFTFFINESIIKTQNPKLFYSYYSSGTNNVTNSTIDGMLYSYHITPGSYPLDGSLVGEKDGYFVFVGIIQNNVNMSSLASTIAADIP